MRNDVMCSGQICAALVWWQHPAAPGERGHTSPAQWVRGGRGHGQISRHSEPLSYTTLIDEWPLWCDDPQNRTKWEHENWISLSDNNILPCNKQLNVKGIHSFLTKKILSDQDPKPVGDNNPDIELGERRSNLWQSANGLYWSVYFVSMSDWFASFDRQLDHHFLLSVCTIHGLMMQDKARCYFSSVSWAHLNLQMVKARLGLAVTKRLSRQIFPPFFVCLWLGLGSVPSHGYTVIIHSGPDNERISRNKMDPCLGQNTLTSAWPIAESSELRFESKLVQ